MAIITKRRVIITSALGAAAAVLSGGGWWWRNSTVSIGPDEIGVVIAHVGEEMPPGLSLAMPGQKGVRESVLAPGVHKINPLTESVERFPIVTISAGSDSQYIDGKVIKGIETEVGIITSLVGRPLPEGEFMANPGEQGTLRKVLVPGKYALNPYAHRVAKVPATVIEAGYVGVVTHMTGEPAATDLVKRHQRGVLEDPLPPGLYWINTTEFRVTKVKVGYHEISFENNNTISFPSADGDTVKIDVTVVWGILPGDAPHVVQQFGAEKDVVDNAISPQVESKARVAGSNYSSRQFVEGDSRDRFQDEFYNKLKEELETKRIRVLLALVRNIDVPESVRKPIQGSKVALEEEHTNRVKTETAKVLTALNEIRGEVEIEATKVRAASNITVREAKDAADGMRARFDAFGSAVDYCIWRLAESLPENLKIELRDMPAAAGAAAAGDPEWVKSLASMLQQSGGGGAPAAK